MKPLWNRVLIEPIVESNEIAGGIVRPEDSKKKEVSKGKVISVGEKVQAVKPGDIVLFSPYHYDEIRKDLFVIEDGDIWVIEERAEGTETTQ